MEHSHPVDGRLHVACRECMDSVSNFNRLIQRTQRRKAEDPKAEAARMSAYFERHSPLDSAQLRADLARAKEAIRKYNSDKS